MIRVYNGLGEVVVEKKDGLTLFKEDIQKLHNSATYRVECSMPHWPSYDTVTGYTDTEVLYRILDGEKIPHIPLMVRMDVYFVDFDALDSWTVPIVIREGDGTNVT